MEKERQNALEMEEEKKEETQESAEEKSRRAVSLVLISESMVY